MIHVNPYALADARERAGHDGWIHVPEIGYVRAKRLGPVLAAAEAKRGRSPHPEASISIEPLPRREGPGASFWPVGALVFSWPAHAHPRGRGRSRGATIKLRIDASPVTDETRREYPLLRPTVEGLRERDPSRGVICRGQYRRGHEIGFRCESVGSIAILVVAEPSEVPRARAA